MSGTLPQLWRATVARDPTALAVVTADDGRCWTRAELLAATEAWCARVPAGAALARKRVALCAPNGIGWWTAFLGLQELGAIPVMVDATEPSARQREIAEHTRAEFLISGDTWVALSRQRRVRDPDHCLVKLTSGSTGVPRAWPFTHAQMIADGRQVCASMTIGPTDVNLGAIPFGHSYGLGNLVIPLVVQGTAVVVVDSPLPNVLATAAAHWRCTVFPTVPAVLNALLRSTVEPAALATLRLVISAGAVMPPALAHGLAERLEITVHNFYGTSETGGICYDRMGEATRSGRSVGTPLEGVQLHWRKGGRFSVASAAVGGRGTFSPLDRGQLNEAGELTLLGRAGRLAKLGARRIALGEIEAVLRSIDGITDAYVAIGPGARPVLAAAIATELSKDQVRLALSSRLAAWKVPEKLVPLPALPITARGKLDRAGIEALLFGAPPKEDPSVSAT